MFHLQGYGNQRFVFQGVHETICYGPSDKPWGENETRINQIVFIGRKLDRKALMEGFRCGRGAVPLGVACSLIALLLTSECSVWMLVVRCLRCCSAVPFGVMQPCSSSAF